MISGALRDVIVLEEPETHSNELGEKVVRYRDFTGRAGPTHRAMVRQISGAESARRGGVATGAGFEVSTRMIPGLSNTLRIRWKNRDNRILYISSIVEEGVTVRSLRITCEEQQ